MELRAEEISQILKDQIANYETRVEVAETGTILSVGDGIARIHGMANAVAGELVEFAGGMSGMVLNLEADNVGVAIFGSDRELKEGDGVKWRGLRFVVEKMAGRRIVLVRVQIVDPLESSEN